MPILGTIIEENITTYFQDKPSCSFGAQEYSKAQPHISLIRNQRTFLALELQDQIQGVTVMTRKPQIRKRIAGLSRLTVYYYINQDELIAKIKKSVISEAAAVDPGEILHHLIKQAEKNCHQGDLWQNYLLDLIISAENPFSLACERMILSPQSSLYQAALQDIKILKKLLDLTTREILSAGQEKKSFSQFRFLKNNYQPVPAFTSAPESDHFQREIPDLQTEPRQGIEQLNKYYNQQGAGQLNKYQAFFWNGPHALRPVKNLDPVNFTDLLGYEKQQQQLIANTRAFIENGTAHNVLLYGESGTGKSSSVKAVLNKFSSRGLRLLEINSSQIKELPDILEYLNQRGLKFLIFMDDLSFEEFETEYKHLKNIMEGGIEARPENVLFYATSNRRHLVQEKWQSRESEVHEREMMNERLSLAERFGLTILFNTPDQQEYLEIVRGLAEQEGIDLPAAVLEEKALKYQMRSSGQSGRTARQFIESLQQS